VLPGETRAAAFAVYAFCRHVDDFVDAREDREATAQLLEAELTQHLEDIEAGRSRLPFAPAFLEVIRQYGIDRELCLELIRGCASDGAAAVRFQSFAELELYCYQVASTVGLMMGRVFGLADATGIRRAVEMGVAMQLTNILRDVDADYRMNRVYLPADELGSAGVGERDLAARKVSEAWRVFMRGQIARARAYYDAGELGLDFLEAGRPRLTARLMSRIYGGILDEIERADYDVFSSRASTSGLRKLGITLHTLLT
jgi:phytoene synthase